MAEKNRFSRLLKYLMSVAEIKNYMLAQELQYDVSYISKWTGGQMLPSEKYVNKILIGISECIVNKCGQEALSGLMRDYQVDSKGDLKQALIDNLEAEYLYVYDQKNTVKEEIVPGTLFYPEIKLAKYITKMWHPVLRRINALDAVAVLDIFSMRREYQLQIAEGRNTHVPKGKQYQDVHYSMVIDVKQGKLDYTYDIVFLMDFLTRNSCVDFKIYGTEQAEGKVIFVVRDEYMISGMLTGDDHCISVMTSENPDYCRVMFRNLKAMCTQDRMLFKKTSMKEMILKYEYIYGLLAPRQQWLLGHLTEHFLPDDLFDEIVKQIENTQNLGVNIGELYSIHNISKNILKTVRVNLLVYRTAFYNLVIDNEIDFFDYKVRLTAEQTVRYLQYFVEFCSNRSDIEIKMAPGRLISDIKYDTKECIFLGDTISYFRLKAEYNNVFIIDRKDMEEAFGKMFKEFWQNKDGLLITDRETIFANINHVINGISGNV